MTLDIHNEPNFKSNEPCCACGESRDGYVCYHHVYTQKANSAHARAKWNLMPLCLKHHTMIHKISMSSMCEKFLGVALWCRKNGWFFHDVLKKWFNKNIWDKND